REKAQLNHEVHKDTYLHVFRNVIRVFRLLTATVKAMDGATQKLLEASVHRTLHSHNFARSSSLATNVLTDLLARFQLELARSCAQRAQHAGRASINPHDVLLAIEDMGSGLDELKDYLQGDAAEMARSGYAYRMSMSTRRAEELAEMRAHVRDGLKQDQDDTVPLVYAPLDPAADYPSSDSEEESEQEEVSAPKQLADSEFATHDNEREEGRPSALDPLHRASSPQKQLPTPPSPYPHKRHKKNNWNAPDYVPEFLPAFPKILGDEDVEPFDLESALPSRAQSTQPQPPPESAPLVKTENLPVSLPPPTAAMNSSDYTDLTPIPYSQSSLAALPEWHLPSAPPGLNDGLSRGENDNDPENAKNIPLHYRHSTLNAAHASMIQSKDTAPTTVQTSSSGVHTIPMSTQGRHSVLLTLQSALNNGVSITMRHFDVPDSLYGAVQPDTRGLAVGRLGGTHAVPCGEFTRDANGNLIKSGSDKPKPQNVKWPLMQSRSTVAADRGVAEMSTRIEGKLNSIASEVLSQPVYSRITRLTHPPPMFKPSGIPYMYGRGIAAPWNSRPSQDDDKSEDKEPHRPDARLWMTWEHALKKPNEPLPPSIPRVSAQVNGRAPRGGAPVGSASSSKLGVTLGRKTKPGAPTLKLNLGSVRNGAPSKAAR
ncbi:hypothetical protein HDZ31DRAFT_27882, partial [Schizophyllum fasciatum]